LEVPVLCAKRTLALVSILDAHLVVSRTQVQAGEYVGIVQLIKEVINAWERVAVLDGHGIQLPVVYAHAHSAIFLLHEQYRRSIRGAARLNEDFV
jgi:hypothetical protein